MNIILTGMPGSGKSTIGTLLAKLIGYNFLDTDTILQNMEGKVLQEIIDNEGLNSFFSAEEKALCAVFCDNTVISTGGSAVYSERAMRHLKNNGKVVYISVPVEELEKRLTNLSTRGVAGAKEKSVAQIFEERKPLYEKYADYTVLCDGVEPIENMMKIADVIKNEIISSRSK